MLRWIAGLVLLLGVAQAPAHADTLAICRANNRDFPQSCGCTIERARAAGIAGATLDKLVANDTSGVPMSVFQRYGLIFVECIQAAVLADVPGAGGRGVPAIAQPPILPPAPAAPPPPRAAAAPIPRAAPAGTGSSATAADPPQAVPAAAASSSATERTPATSGKADARPDAAGIKPIDATRPAGRWGSIGFGGEGFGVLHIGVFSESGAGLILTCGAGQDMTMIAGPFDVPSGSVPGQLAITGGAGFEADFNFTVIEDNYIAHPLFGLAVDRLRSGNEVRISLPQAGTSVTFGLSGSSKAITDFVGRYDCATWRNRTFPRWYPSGLYHYSINSTWRPSEIRLDAPLAMPTLSAGVNDMMFANIDITCDRRLVLRGLGQQMHGRYTLVVDPLYDGVSPRSDTAQPRSFPIEIGEAWASGVLPDAALAALESGRQLRLTGPADGEPGNIYSATYSLEGFADGLAGLACRPPPAPRQATARTDLAGSPAVWRPFTFDFYGSGEPWRAALYNPDGAPALYVGCQGDPAFDGGAFGLIGDQTLRFEIDDDPQRQIDIVYGNYRAFLNPTGGDELDRLGRAVLKARTLRVTALGNTDHDLRYPLDGLHAALREAGCKG